MRVGRQTDIVSFTVVLHDSQWAGFISFSIFIVIAFVPWGSIQTTAFREALLGVRLRECNNMNHVISVYRSDKMAGY
jgi:hypothetical protein